jgi:PAS domain S-box-containing protein
MATETPLPPNEAERLAALQDLRVLDTAPDLALHEILQLAAEICFVPVAMVSLVDEARLWFKARIGIEAKELPREGSFCAHAILGREVLVVQDAPKDDRFKDHPLVTQEKLRFYTGVPLASEDGHHVGTLCILDKMVRRLEPRQRSALELLARQAARLIQNNRHAQELEETRAQLTDLFTHATAEQAITRALADADTVEEGVRSVLAAIGGWVGSTFGVLWEVDPDFQALKLVEIWRTDGPRGDALEEACRTAVFSPGIGLPGQIWERGSPHCLDASSPEWKRKRPAQAAGYQSLFGVPVHEAGKVMVVLEFFSRAAKVPDQRQMARVASLASQVGPFLSRKRLEADQLRLIAITESTSDLVGISSLDARPLYLNRSGRKMLGLPLDDDTKLKTMSTLDIHPQWARRLIVQEGLPTAEREGSWMGETVVIGTGGREIPVSHQVLAIRDGRGVLRYYAAILRDITERKEVERLKNEFVSTVSHELRTPLTSIRGSLGLLAGGVAGAIPEGARDLVEMAKSNTERLIRLVNDILDLEKMDSGKMELQRDKLSMDKLVESALAGLAGLSSATGVPLAWKAGQEVEVVGDHDRLIQVITNLVSNAIKFSPQGSEVRVELAQHDEMLRVSVVDQGPGINPDKRDQLFKRFQQLDGSDTRKKGGTGLGLAISKAIVEQHGGRIGLDSELAKGSTFWFELPLRETP